MLRYYKLPLIFLFIGSLLGVFLRWQFITPTPGVNYAFFLHAHSHIMFIGWVFNVLYIGFVAQHIDERDHLFFIKLFNVLQVFLVGMLISFPLQGYGFYSIFFSTLHTIGALVFIIRFLAKIKSVTTISAWYARIAVLFFVLSTIGPFSLGYLMSSGMASTQWYNFAIYLYLHFQYNGFFLFGILSLFLNQLEEKKIFFSLGKAKSFGLLLATACIPAYILSTLWAKPGYIFNIIGAIAGLVQCFGLAVLIKLLRENLSGIKQGFTGYSKLLLIIALIGFTLKLLLQLISASPPIAQMAYELRPVVIAYLHLVLVGIVSSFFVAWYLEKNLLKKRTAKSSIILYVMSFLGMELCLLLTPWWNVINKLVVFSASEYTFFFSAFLCLSFFMLAGSAFSRKLRNVSIKID
jgi:hypothetical protein